VPFKGPAFIGGPHLKTRNTVPYILGLDPSVSKAGYAVLDVDKPQNSVEEYGLLKTENTDGILILRLLKQVRQVQEIIEKYNIKFIGMEAPFFEGYSTEILFALNQFLHWLFLKKELYVVCFPPQTLKKLVYPEKPVTEVFKSHMIDRAKTELNLHGHVLAEDAADAFWAGTFGKRFYRWHILKNLPSEELGEYERHVFEGKHTFVKGAKKGSTEYTGLIFRENELFFNFEKIKRGIENAKEIIKENNEKKRTGRGTKKIGNQ
jgi:Holliday junction resolvasome RuvABC endonuclease subunit